MDREKGEQVFVILVYLRRHGDISLPTRLHLSQSMCTKLLVFR